MMSGDRPSRAGRLTALATLAVSAALFLTALLGISAIDPTADAGGFDRPAAPAESISLAPASTDGGRDGDCPRRDRDHGGAGAPERSSGPHTS